MFFLFSGEGPTDLGGCRKPSNFCRSEEFVVGPMAVIVDQIVFHRHRYSPLEAGICGYVPKRALIDRAMELKSKKKSAHLPGAKTPKETGYFFQNARVLSRIALELQSQIGDEVVAVLFRDSDGVQSSNRGLWKDKFQSMLNGFESERFFRGVPMIPKPKSEAWILYALKYDYQQCEFLEARSGNDNSPKSLKAELVEHHGTHLSSQSLVELVRNRTIDISRLDMPSFNAFRKELERVISPNEQITGFPF